MSSPTSNTNPHVANETSSPEIFPRKNKLKNVILTFLKLIIAVGLVLWVFLSGKLDFKSLLVFVDHFFVLLSLVLLWSFGFVCLGGLRWFILLRGLDLKVTFFRTLQMHLIGLFFNSALPGAVGGDIVKAVYVMRDNQTVNKTSSLLTVLLDRIIGLFGMFTIGGIMISFDLQRVLNHPDTRTATITLFCALLGLFLFFCTVFIPYKGDRDPFVRFFAFCHGKIPGFSMLSKIYTALRSYRKKPSALIYAWLLSVVIQLGVLLFFIFVTEVMTHQTIDFISYSSIFPLGLFTTALPIAPGGMGIGHVAFEKLYQSIGLSGGANVFNAYFLGCLCLNALGFIPYIFFRAKQKTGACL